MKKLTDDKLAFALENNCFVEGEIDRKNQPTMQDLYLRLNKYEKLEEEIGCPLDVVIKALKEGIYFYDNYYKDQILNYIPVLQYDHFICGTKPYIRMLKDYKKTWWLKENKEE